MMPKKSMEKAKEILARPQAPWRWTKPYCKQCICNCRDGLEASWGLYGEGNEYILDSCNDCGNIFYSEENGRLIAAAPAIAAALKALYEDTAHYITLNHLGDVHHNRNMQMARDALEMLKEKP